MKPLALLLGVATLAAFAAILGFAAYSETLQFLPSLFLDAFLITKLVLILLLVVLALVALLPNGKGQGSDLLAIMGWLALGLGLLASLVALSNVLRAVAATGTSNLKVIGPSLSEGLMPIAFGLLVATVAMARAGKRFA